MNRLSVRARYGFAGGVLVSLMVMAATGAGRAATNEVARWQPGKFDDRAIDCLRESTQILKLRATTLKEVAPAYFVAGTENLSWEEAVARADREFGNDGDRRALFLRKFLPDGSPVERLAELKLPDMGFSTGTGSGHSKTYGLGVTWKEESVTLEEEPMPNARDAKTKKPGFVAKVRTPKAKATLSFWVSPGGKTLGALVPERQRYKGQRHSLRRAGF